MGDARVSAQTGAGTTGLSYQLIDGDNHYYEPYDCFTRFIEPAFADRAINVRVDDKGRGKLYFGDRQFRFMRVIQTDYVGAPGSLREMLDDPNNQEGFVHKQVIRGWDFPDMMQRDARIAKMDEQGVQTGLMLGTAMLQAENELHDDIPALYANIRSYNRWLDAEWGFDRDGHRPHDLLDGRRPGRGRAGPPHRRRRPGGGDQARAHVGPLAGRRHL